MAANVTRNMIGGLLKITCMLLVLSNKGKGMQSSSEQPLVGGSFRDDTNNGCERDYGVYCVYYSLNIFRNKRDLSVCHMSFRKIMNTTK